MKPLKLVMSGFGPFAGREEIDFENAGLDGVFLITGDTGAGKTTIFDAVSFALYGEASGEWRSCDNFRSGYAQRETETFVELTFLQRGKRYRLTRNPEYFRPSKRGQKLARQRQKAVLEYPDGTNVEGITQVNEAVLELLGLERRQFKQISMIAQGEFLKLLTATSKERGEIFRKVFDTESYLNLQKQLDEKRKQLEERCRQQDQKVIYLIQQIQEETEFAQMEELKECQKETNTLRAKECLDQLVIWEEKERLQKKRILEQKEQEEIKSQKELEMARDEETLFLQLSQERARLKELQEQECQDQETEEKLALAKKAWCEVFPFEQKWTEVKAQLEELERQIQEKERELKEEEIREREWKTEEEKWEQDRPKLEEKKKKIEDFERKLPIRREKKKWLKEEKSLSIQKEELEKKKKQIRKEREELEQEQKKISVCTEEEDAIEKELGLCDIKTKQIDRQKKAIWQLFSQHRQLDKTKKEEKELLRQFENKRKEWEEIADALREKERQFFGNLAGILAQELKEEQPCPVCGSLDHPCRAKLISSDITEEEWKASREEEAEKKDELHQQKIICEKKHTEIDSTEASIQIQIRELEQEILKKDGSSETQGLFCRLEILETQNKELEAQTKKDQKIWEKKLKQKQEEKRRIQEIAEQIKRCEKEEREEQEKEREWYKSWSKCQAQLETLAGQLGESWEEEDLEEKIQTWKTEIEQAEFSRQEIQEKRQRTKEEIIRKKVYLDEKQENSRQLSQTADRCEREWKDAWSGQGFLTEDTYRSALMDEQEMDQLGREIRVRKEQREKLEMQIGIGEERLQGKERRDLSDLEHRCEELESEKRQWRDVYMAVSNRAKTNGGIQKQIAQLGEQQEKERRIYTKYKELSDTANGTLNGKEKMAFEQYVQSFYFRQVVQKANQRFYKMSGGQYELRCMERASDKKKSAGLELEIMDYYIGSVRPVKSLSGGESFQAALSLALGLSDVIQSYAGGIAIDAVFIDEGFGSLDSSALEQAVQVLKELSSENRMVGIISHVAELKERIEKKVELTKTRHGSTIALYE